MTLDEESLKFILRMATRFLCDMGHTEVTGCSRVIERVTSLTERCDTVHYDTMNAEALYRGLAEG